MEQMEQYSQQMPIVSSLTDERRVAFYKKTYTHLAMAVLLFIIVETIFFQIPLIRDFAISLTGGFSWLLLLGGFMLVTSYAEKMAIKSHDINKQYLGLLLYVIAEAFIFIPMIYMAMLIAEAGGKDILSQAAVLTLALFTGLSAIAL